MLFTVIAPLAPTELTVDADVAPTRSRVTAADEVKLITSTEVSVGASVPAVLITTLSVSVPSPPLTESRL